MTRHFKARLGGQKVAGTGNGAPRDPSLTEQLTAVPAEELGSISIDWLSQLCNNCTISAIVQSACALRRDSS